jgi:hypothetical protein
MWLVFLKFEGEGQVRTTHVHCGNQQEAREAIERAKGQQEQPRLKLTEYVLFYSARTIYQKEANTFPLLFRQDDRPSPGA